MVSLKKDFPGRGTVPYGVHPPENKNFSGKMAIEMIPAPDMVILPLLQHTGAPSAHLVNPRQEVAFGQKIAKGQAFVSANLHASVSGIAQKLTVTTLPNGRHVKAIPIKAQGEQISGQALWDEVFGGDWPKNGFAHYQPQQIAAAVNEAGIVGLGGAAFPSHVKLIPTAKKPIDTLLINGCECEPYLTSDDRLMIEAPDPIVTGALLSARATGAKDIYIGIEDNKPEAIESMRKSAAGTGIKIAVLKTKYPQGGEKNLIRAIIKRAVPSGGLPMDVGVAVVNVGTAAAIARAVIRQKPLTHRIVCVTGAGIKNPKNLLVPIGISFGELIDYCGGLTDDAVRLIAGGPMMGFAFTNLGMVVTKGSSGLTVLTQEDIHKAEETACIRCGQCVKACSMQLVPAKLAQAVKHQDWEMAEKYHILDCHEGGCCTYICPAKLPLMQFIRSGKVEILKQRRSEQAKKGN